VDQMLRIVLIVIASVVLLLIALPLLFGGLMMGGMMGGWRVMSPWGSALFMGFGALVVAGLVLIVVWAARQGERGEQDRGRSPLDIAKERYARGELTREQYEQIRRDLT
jgi:putative membrane protein